MSEADLLTVKIVRADLRWLLILLGSIAHKAHHSDLERIRNILKEAMRSSGSEND